MATGVERRKAPAAESMIERRLAETCRRIRLFDAGASGLLFGVVVFAYALAFAVFDLATRAADADWAQAARWVAYFVFLGIAGAVGLQALRRLTRRVNPYYAAHRLEETVPGAKNSVINWLDLRDAKLPPALRTTIGSKAAQDLEEADAEQAVDRQATWVMLAIFSVLLLGMLVLVAVRPSQFFSLMRRAFVPFYHSQLATQTRITMHRPEAGDATVTEKQPITFMAEIDGRIPEVNQPGAPALLYRSQPGDKFVVQPLRQDGDGRWTTRLLADQVGSTGFWYQVTAGDAATPVYQISVRAQPLVVGYEVAYKYRLYLKLPDRTVGFPNRHAALPSIKGHRGTEVTLVVHTNRPLRQSSVAIATAKTKRNLPTRVMEADPQAFTCRWTLEQSGEGFVSFTSLDGETYLSRVPFPVEVDEDTTPSVVLTRPKQDVELPANGTLEIAGMATDDLGLKELTLRLQLVASGGAVALKPQPYRPDKPLDLDGNGSFYPPQVDYFDLLKLDELKTSQDQLAKLQPGAVVEYWLEATDNSDYPNKGGNVGKSASYRIKIVAPQDEAKQEAARAQGKKKQEQHHAQQDQKLAQDKKQQEQKNAGAGGSGGEKEQADRLGKDVQNGVDKLDQQNDSSDKGDAKGKEPDRSENKPGGGDGADAPSAGQKDEKPGDPNQTGNSKESPQPSGADKKPGESKDAGPPDEGKGGEQGGAGQPKEDPMKGGSKEGPKDSAADGKGDDQGGAQEKSSQTKEAGPDLKAPDQAPQAKGADAAPDAPGAQSKPGGDKGTAPSPSGPAPPGQAKGEDAEGQRSVSKEQGPDNAKKIAEPLLKGADDKTTEKPDGIGKGEVKKAPPGAAKEGPGLAKGAGPATQDAKQSSPTAQDVEHLKELMQRKDGIGDMAAKALTQMSKDAPDPKVRELAKDALDEAGKKVIPGDEPGASPAAPKTAVGKPPQGSKGDPGEQDPKPGNPGQASETKTGQGPNNTKKGEDRDVRGIGGTKPGPGRGPSDGGKVDPARKDLSGFGGSLQVEDFIKRATPAYRAKYGIPDDEWQRLLTKAAQYDALLRKLQKRSNDKTPREARGTAGQLDGAGLRQVEGAANATDPLDPGQAEPPPELLDAQRRFTNPGSRPTP